MAIVLDGSNLTIENLVRIARFGEKVELEPGRAPANPRLPDHARGEAGRTRNHVRHEHRHRRVLREAAERRAGEGVPAVSRLQPRGRDRRAVPGRARARRDRGAHQRARPRQLGLPARYHADVRGNAQQGRHARCLPEGIRGRVRRPRADGAARAAADGRRRSLSTRASGCPAPKRCDRAGIAIPGLARARRARGHQRVEPADRHVRPPPLRHGTVAQAGRHRRGDVDRGAARQPQAVPRQAARAARLPWRHRVGREHHEGRRRVGPDDRQDEDQGAGRLLDAVDAAGHRRRARRDRLRPVAGRDRAERRRRQPDLRARDEADADRRELPGLARVACRWTWPARRSRWCR